MISLRSGQARLRQAQPGHTQPSRRAARETERLPAVWLVAALLPLILLGGWLSQFA